MATYQCFDREFYDTIINVKVGPKENEQIFQIHKGVLAHSSSYIKKVLDGGVYKKGDELVVKLHEVDPKALQHLQW